MAMMLVSGCPSREKSVSHPKKDTISKATTNKRTVVNPSLPWENNRQFLQAKKELGVRLLMASYHATLPDPILNERHNIALGKETANIHHLAY
jgi:hypothetical protein